MTDHIITEIVDSIPAASLPPERVQEAIDYAARKPVFPVPKPTAPEPPLARAEIVLGGMMGSICRSDLGGWSMNFYPHVFCGPTDQVTAEFTLLAEMVEKTEKLLVALREKLTEARGY